MIRLLVAEDEPSLALTLDDRLRAEGYEVELVESGTAAFAAASTRPFDLLILDVNLPGKNGLDLCRDLRARGLETPILMLTARAGVVDKVLGLKLGADDYLTKPFDWLELSARLEALLRRRRAGNAATSLLVLGEVRVDFEAAEVKKSGQPIELSTLELRLLQYLAEHRGKVIGRDELLDKVWGYASTSMSRTVDVHMSSLRQKIEEQPAKPRFLHTVFGRGYKLVV